jgi:uncharacterized protein (TIGR01777 family)
VKLVIAGASGFIGSVFVDRLWRQSHTLTLLSRKPPAQPKVATGAWVTWEPGAPGEWEKFVDGSDGIINLAGEPIASRRWTEAQKERIFSSRIDTTQALVRAVAKAKQRPKFLINASAVGYYGPHGDEILTEESPAGKDFLARVCVSWEEEARRAEDLGLRVARLRSGIVLGKGKGALAKMVTPFKFFLGGPLGSGKQWMPWIHIDDEVGLIEFLMEKSEAAGAFNATAPNPVTMEEFSKTLGDVLKRPSWTAVPASILTLILGEMADMVLTGQRALPQAAQKLGYSFKQPVITAALESLKL